MDDRQRLNKVIERRDQAKAKVQKIHGRLESARESLASVEADCRKRGIEPDQLDVTIETLREKGSRLIAQIEAEMDVAEKALAPFLGEET